MKNLRKNKKFVLGASVALTALMLAAATFAWFSAQDSVDNEFSTGGIPKDSVKVWEIFEKPEEWKPGQEVDKKVAVANLGKEAIFVRASFNETISKMKADPTDATNLLVQKFDTEQSGLVPVPTTDYAADSTWQEASAAGYTVTGLPAGTKLYVKDITVGADTKIAYAAVSSANGVVSGKFDLDDSTKAITVTNAKFEYYERDTDVTENWTTTINADNTVSHVDPKIKLSYLNTNMAAPAANGKWFYNTTDGWFYYGGTVAGGSVSPTFLDSVTLDKNADNSYQYLDYKLTVNVEGLQATEAALEQWNVLASGATADLHAAMVAGL